MNLSYHIPSINDQLIPARVCSACHKSVVRDSDDKFITEQRSGARSVSYDVECQFPLIAYSLSLKSI